MQRFPTSHFGTVDNLTHSLVGAALAEAGPRYRFALATPVLILAANVPDVDVISYAIGGEYAALAWRRGITHGVPALLLWPVVVAGLMIGWDRYARRRRDPTIERARFAPLLGLAALGALTHPVLDWLNTYGMRWWLPFDGTWSYGDALFIIDPWLWLMMGLPVFMARSQTRRSLTAWAVLTALASLLVLGTGMVSTGTRIVWLAGILAVAAARWLRPPGRRARRRLARAALAGAATYVALMVGAAALAERGAYDAAHAAGLEPVDVMNGPQPGGVMARDVIIRTASAYHSGSWRWGRSPRLELGDSVSLRGGPPAVLAAALEDSRVRHFLVWSRYPYMHAVDAGDGWQIRVGDARYTGRGLGGLDVSIPVRVEPAR